MKFEPTVEFGECRWLIEISSVRCTPNDKLEGVIPIATIIELFKNKSKCPKKKKMMKATEPEW